MDGLLKGDDVEEKIENKGGRTIKKEREDNY